MHRRSPKRWGPLTVSSAKTKCSRECRKKEFRKRLARMFPYRLEASLSERDVDVIRMALFPEIRIRGRRMPRVRAPAAAKNRNKSDERGEIVTEVMDLHQEQVARNMGGGHRVIHGVAGSGKTLLIVYRARRLLAQMMMMPRSEEGGGRGTTTGSSSSAVLRGAEEKHILVVCYNEALATMLLSMLERSSSETSTRIQVSHFHKWCREQLVAHQLALPDRSLDVAEKMRQLVDRVIEGVRRGQIPRGQYRAILIDEGHDFEPSWLKLFAEDMLDPETKDLLYVHDDAQNIYRGKSCHTKFSFKSVGIEARGRTTILRTNYRNTKQIVETVNSVSADVLKESIGDDDDSATLVGTIASLREGEMPHLVDANNLRKEAVLIAQEFNSLHGRGFDWREMVILSQSKDNRDLVAEALASRQIPHQVRTGPGTFDPSSNSVKIFTIHAAKGLEFPVVAVVGVGQMKSTEQDIRLFHVGATRATEILLIGASGNGPLIHKIRQNAL